MSSPSVATAQLAMSSAVDAGVTRYASDVALADGTPQQQTGASVSLGIDLAILYGVANTAFGGLAMEASFFAAGPEPSHAIEFLLGGRLAYRRGFLHVEASGGWLLSAFDDRCDGALRIPERCAATRPSEAVGTGWGATLSPLLSLPLDASVSLLVGPTIRYRRASIDYLTGGEFTVETWQVALGAHLFVSFPD